MREYRKCMYRYASSKTNLILKFYFDFYFNHTPLPFFWIFLLNFIHIIVTWRLFLFQNISIKPAFPGQAHWYIRPLHSIMFLLKPTRRALPASGSPLFTFHNVSIKTKDCPSIPRVHIALHSTMFLLKPIAGLFVNATDCTLHSTMFLYKTCGYRLCQGYGLCFTFHNVSIKTQKTYEQTHSHSELYIPQCFY